MLCCVCGVLGLPAPVHRCARSVCCVGCAVSWASRLLFTGVPAGCVVLRVRCPGPPGSCSPVCLLGVLCCVCAVLGLPAPVHRCARSVCCVACAVSWASRLLFTGVPARCVVLRVRCPGPPGSCSPVCPLVCCVACAVSWASRLLFTGVPARCVVLRVRCPGPPGSCSPVPPLSVLCCVCGVLGLPAPVHRCARSVCCVACAVSWAFQLLFTGVPTRCIVLRVRCPGPPGFVFTGVPNRCVVLCVRCPGPPGSCSPVCLLGVLCCVCGDLGLPAPVHRCACSVCCVACAVSWANWLLFTGVPARCVVLRVRCPGPPGSCSPVRPLSVLCCVCGVRGLLAPVHRCARSVCRFACAVSWASWLLFTGVPARCVVLLCGASLRGAHPSIRTAAIVAGRGWVPSGRTAEPQRNATRRDTRHITRHDETQHQTTPDATRKTGHHETRNPIHTHTTTHSTTKQRKNERNPGNPPGTSTKHNTPRRTTTPHHYTQRKHHHQLQPDATTYHHHDMNQHSAAHRDAPRNTTATQRNVPQGGTRRKPALHNNVTQHAIPQPNGSYTTPHNTAQYCTARPTAKKNNTKRGMAQPTPGTTRHHLTPHSKTTQHTLRHDATPQPGDNTRPNAIQRGTT